MRKILYAILAVTGLFISAYAQSDSLKSDLPQKITTIKASATTINIIIDSISQDGMKRNSYNRMILPLLLFNSISIGYGRDLGTHHHLAISIAGRINYRSMDLDREREGNIRLDYKYFLRRTVYRYNLWGGIYTLFNKYHSYNEGDLTDWNGPGIGLSLGQILYLTKKKKSYLELGYGHSVILLKERAEKEVHFGPTYTYDEVSNFKPITIIGMPRIYLNFGIKF